MMRNRKLLIALAFALLLGWRLLPESLGPLGGQSSGPAPAGTASRGGQARATPQTVTIGSQQLQEELRPFLVLRTGQVRRGGPLVVGGQLFEPYQELELALRGEGGDDDSTLVLGTAVTDKNGVMADTSFPLPENLASGVYAVVAVPTMGGGPVEASVRVESDQTWGRLTSDTTKPYSAVGFEAGGFKPGENVAVYLDNLGTQPLSVAVASDQGDISGVLRVPFAQEGSHSVLFYGDQSRMPAEVGLTILGFYPWVVLDNYSPGPEQQVGFAGSDFAPGETVHVFFNSLESGPVAAVQVGDDGTFKAPGAVRLAPGLKGEQTLLFVGNQSQTTSEVEFTIQPYPSVLQLTLWAGPPGSEVAFVGNGFAAGEEVNAYVGEPGQGAPVSTFRADEKGNFSDAGAIRIPHDAEPGEFTLSVTGQVSGTQASVVFKVLPLSPWVEVRPDLSGGTVVVGHGFAVGEQVDLAFGQSGDKVSATAQADRQGNAEFPSMEVPREGERGTSIQLKGRDSGGEARTNYYAGPPAESGGEPESPGSLEFRPEETPGAATPTARPARR
ncbi:MAG: hypothetical protein ACM3US_07000 [Sphingomonadaceae bacterium]